MTGSALLHAAPLRPIADSLRAGTLDAAENLADVLARFAAVDSRVHAFLPEPDRPGRMSAALGALHSATAGRTRPPLYGVPLAVKDLFRVEGLPTRAGSRLPPDLFEGPESRIVTRLRRAGCIVLGKTHMDEFACSEPPPTRNPHDPARTPGGSSSGSAAAVASGMAPLAIGSHTQRSVIGPAAFCGVVGFKPSYGRVPFDGVPMAVSADTIGLFAQDVPGVELASAVLIDDWRKPEPAQPVLGIASGESFLGPLPPSALASFGAQIETLRRSGLEIRDVTVPWDASAEHWTGVLSDLLLSELADVHRQWFAAYATLYRPRTAAAIRDGLALPSARGAQCRELLPGLRPMIEQAMNAAGIDAWICPSSLGPAPEGLDMTGYVETTLMWSWAGLPCLSLPAGPPAGRLPLGLQLVGRYGADESVLAWAADLELRLR